MNPTDPDSVHGQFSSSLRTRSTWKVIGPVLTTQATHLTESQLPGHDFEFYTGNESAPLYVLFLTPSSLYSNNKEHTISRLASFSTVSSPERCIIALLLSEDPFNSASGKYSLDALLTLQVITMEALSVSIPILPIPDSSCFLGIMKEYMRGLVDIPVQESSMPDSINLLAHTTSDAGVLSEQDTNILSDLFPSFGVMSRALQTQDGQDILRDHLGDETARDILDFWARDRAFD